MKALSPVINQIPLPSNSNNNDSPVTTSESCDTSHDLVPIGEQFLNESFPDVKNLQLLPLPPLPPPPTSSSCRQEVSIDSPPGSPLSQDLPPLPAPVVTTPLPVKQEIDGGSNEVSILHMLKSNNLCMKDTIGTSERVLYIEV